jgi:restriction endonuclease
MIENQEEIKKQLKDAFEAASKKYPDLLLELKEKTMLRVRVHHTATKEGIGLYLELDETTLGSVERLLKELSELFEKGAAGNSQERLEKIFHTPSIH